MTEETTTEQLAEIEGQTECTALDGWRLLASGETLQEGDQWIRPWDGRWISVCVGSDAAVSEGQYIRQIASEPDCQTEEIQYLRREISTLQNQLGESRQRVTQLEELVASLRTINETQEKAFEAAGKENTALRLQVQNRQQEHEQQKSRIEFLETLNAGNGAAIDNYRAMVEKLQGLVDTAREQLEAAATERDELRAAIDEADKQLDEKDAEIRDLRIELDAAQQVPQPVSDRFEEGWDAGTARAVETIAEWLEPIRHLIDAADNMAETEQASNLAADIIRALPVIMRTLAGLTPED